MLRSRMFRTISSADLSNENEMYPLGARMAANNVAKLFENYLRAFLTLFDIATLCSIAVLDHRGSIKQSSVTHKFKSFSITTDNQISKVNFLNILTV